MKEAKHRINNQIKHYQVRIIGDGIESRIVSTNEALKIASELELDLIEINSNSTPAICKIADYGKMLYEANKKDKGQKNVDNKEIRLGPNIGDHDLEIKLNQTIKFLEKGARVKVSMKFKGREIVYKTNGEMIMLKFAESLNEHGIIDAMPKLEGKSMFMNIKPKPKNK